MGLMDLIEGAAGGQGSDGQGSGAQGAGAQGAGAQGAVGAVLQMLQSQPGGLQGVLQKLGSWKQPPRHWMSLADT